MTINVVNRTTDITPARRAGLLATAVLGLSLIGVAASQPVQAAPPDHCNGLLKTDQVQPGVPFVGTAQDEVIGGTFQADDIDGGGGNDTICGWDGIDVIEGGEDADWISGGADNDTIRGWGGGDVLYGNSDNDELYGGDGNDILRGGDGVDSLSGGNDDDLLHCSTGVDVPADGGPHIVGDVLYTSTNHGCETWLNVP